MGIRETLNENPRLTTGVTIGVIALVLIYILWSSLSGGGTTAGGDGVAGGKYYFTVDDGKTYFAEDAKKVPPFDYNGKEAVRAHVFKCDGKEPFVNHLERYSKDAKKKLEDAITKGSQGDPTIMEAIQTSGLEFKAPGAKDWVKVTDPKHGAILQPKCSDPSTLEVVLPD